MTFSIRQQTVTVKRDDIIDALHQGLKKHKIEYRNAVSEYEEACVKFLEEALEHVKSGVFDREKITLSLIKPENYSDEYQRILDMLEYSVDETLTLDADTFRAYFKGEWSWQARFNDIVGSTKAYLGK